MHMKTRTFALLLPVFLALAGVLHAASPAKAHAWESIDYPSIPMPGVERERLELLVGSGGVGGEASHLRFDILWNAARDAQMPAAIADPGKFVVRLHLPDGKVVLPEADGHPLSWIGAGSRGMTWSLIYIFPWQQNAMDEAWIELTLAGQTYWVELPYGFTRDPADPLPTDEKRNTPVFPPAMKALGEKDRLVPWLHVDYDLGKIQNGWQLSFRIANPFDAKAEAILYRDDMQVGRSIYLWQLDTPRVAMRIKTQDDGNLAARAMGIRLHEDGLRRSDEFSFNRYPAEGRDWGKVVIKVGDKAYECVVPSSLFKYTHGVTDPENVRRMARPAEAREP